MVILFNSNLFKKIFYKYNIKGILDKKIRLNKIKIISLIKRRIESNIIKENNKKRNNMIKITRKLVIYLSFPSMVFASHVDTKHSVALNQVNALLGAAAHAKTHSDLGASNVAKTHSSDEVLSNNKWQYFSVLAVFCILYEVNRRLNIKEEKDDNANSTNTQERNSTANNKVLQGNQNRRRRQVTT